METLYTAEALSTGGGRSGHVRTTDGVLDLAVPASMGGAGGAAANPELLFAAGYAACFHGALQAVARAQKVSIHDTAVGSKVSIGPNGQGGGEGVQLRAQCDAVLGAENGIALRSQLHALTAALPVRADGDLGADRGVVDRDLLRTGDGLQCAVEAGGVAGGEEQLGVGGGTPGSAHRGGHGEVEHAIADLEQRGDRKVSPVCWYVAEWFEKNPDRAGIVAAR
ncbi:Ohr family peroxiredoxin [Ralstonia pickettii]|uniref:Ohr family peroxiredoxin n=1 Tax=Ralstonia pickettii TaxID=329 RepID=UPI0026B5B845